MWDYFDDFKKISYGQISFEDDIINHSSQGSYIEVFWWLANNFHSGLLKEYGVKSQSAYLKVCRTISMTSRQSCFAVHSSQIAW